ncbi:MAG: type IV pilin protein [Syntrophorhabdaceae bacterium]|nr:type IV pilin protein [Syntrophorhabdaceae bacterium]MDD5243112.1 type IV pilin protein [Syntrophorhabdaceae bacterium]
MGNKAFTVIEMLIMVGVMSAILLIALPMYAMRAKRPDRVQAKAQLCVIRDAEERYKLHYGTYTTDVARLANWKPILGRYQFRIRTADSTQFVAQADGDLNNDKIYDDDTWTIDQSGTLKKVK